MADEKKKNSPGYATYPGGQDRINAALKAISDFITQDRSFSPIDIPNQPLNISPPTRIPAPEQVDYNRLFELYQKAAPSSELPERPGVPRRSGIGLADRSNEREALEATRPNRAAFVPESKITGLQRALGGAAAGAGSVSAEPGNAGQIIALAAAGMLGAEDSYEQRQREYGLDYEAALEEFNLRRVQQFQRENDAQQAMLEANNEIDFFNAMAVYNDALAGRAEVIQRQNELRDFQVQSFGIATDFAQRDAAQKDKRSQVDFENADAIREFYDPTILGSDDTSITYSQNTPEGLRVQKSRVAFPSPQEGKIALVDTLLRSGYADKVFNPFGPFNDKFEKARRQVDKDRKRLVKQNLGDISEEDYIRRIVVLLANQLGPDEIAQIKKINDPEINALFEQVYGKPNLRTITSPKR